MPAKTTDINKNYRFFRVKGSRRHRMLDISTICLILAETKDTRNKEVFTINGEKIIILNYTNDYLLNICPHLIQIGKAVLISPAIIKERDTRYLYLNIKRKGFPSKVILGNIFKKEIKKLTA